MGRSFTYHVIGEGPLIDGKKRIYAAMNRLEIKQELEKARKEGDSILTWYAQTRTGCRVLGNENAMSWPIKTEHIPLPKTVTCPICEGEGHNGKYFCVICNGSGICKPGNEKKWLPWQLEEMKKWRNHV